MGLKQAIRLVLFLAAIPMAVHGQQPEQVVTLGALRVPACTVSSDPEYGLVEGKPIQLGGGPSNAAARMARYVGALRGPMGQTLQLSNSRGSLSAPAGYWSEPTILDHYTVSIDGKNISLYVDTYHFSLPKAPVGFTCGGPLVTALGLPPLDPVKNNSSVVALAIERGTAREVVPIALDAANPRGYLLDQFTMIALRARAAATAGTPLDPNKPPAGMEPAGSYVLAYPITCGNRMIAPKDIELSANQTPVQRLGDLIHDEVVARAFAVVSAPAGSLGGRFRPGQVNQARITYAEPCEGKPAEVSLPINVQPPRVLATPGLMPPGVSEPDPTVYLQVILDTDGKFVRPIHIGGPRSLVQRAIETINTWKAEPLRFNGIPTIYPMIVQLIFR